MPTQIEWADETWNPITGCTKISEGCANCYAERMARRLAARFGYPEMPHHFDVTVHLDKMDQPLRWKKPRRIFVCSMGDLFHDHVTGTCIRKIWATMALAPQHTFLILTKRPKRMKYEMNVLRDLASAEQWTITELARPLPNVWLGVTVENSDYLWRIDELLKIPAAGHFVSLEPMLGAVDLASWLPLPVRGDLTYGEYDIPVPIDLALSWVIAGGESGAGARPTHPDWVRLPRDQCQESGTPFLFKQWGKWMPDSEWHRSSAMLAPHAKIMSKGFGCDRLRWSGVGKKAAGRLLDGRTWDEYPEACQ